MILYALQSFYGGNWTFLNLPNKTWLSFNVHEYSCLWKKPTTIDWSNLLANDSTCKMFQPKQILPEVQVFHPSWFLKSTVPFHFPWPPLVLKGHQLTGAHSQTHPWFLNTGCLCQIQVPLLTEEIHVSWIHICWITLNIEIIQTLVSMAFMSTTNKLLSFSVSFFFPKSFVITVHSFCMQKP